MDKTHPLKFESIASGGSSNDNVPTEINPNEDAVDCFGLSLQNTTSRDQMVNVTRTGDEMVLKDISNAVKLAQLLKVASHAGLPDLIHFLPDGPADGWATGAYRTMDPFGAILPTTITWWTSAAMTAKIIEKTLTYSGILPSAITWKIYSGATLLRTLTDTITYSGIVETSRIRTWT